MSKTEIRQLILNRFVEQKSRPNHIIDQRWIEMSLMPKLNPKEQEFVQEVVNGLANDGIITIEKRSSVLCLVLTESGYELIYPINKQESVDEIQNKILQKFKSQNSKVGNIIPFRWVTQQLIPSLNPKEQDLVQESVNDLVDKGLISIDNNSMLQSLVLTQAGFDQIY